MNHDVTYHYTVVQEGNRHPWTFVHDAPVQKGELIAVGDGEKPSIAFRITEIVHMTNYDVATPGTTIIVITPAEFPQHIRMAFLRNHPNI